MKEGKKHQRGDKVAFPGTDSEPGMNLRGVMNARGAELLRALGQQMNAHLTSVDAFQAATNTLTFHCSNTVLEIAKLLEAIQQYQASHSDVLAETNLLRRIIAEFAQHVHNTRSLGTTPPPPPPPPEQLA